MMRISIIIIAFLCQCINVNGQEESSVDLIDIDSTWGQEIFHFPIHFAPGIDYKGVEDARFPKGWSTKDSTTYWSYAFAWSIEHDGGLTENELEENIEKYFDGLMSGIDKARADSVQSPTAIFIEQDVNRNISQYIGKVNTLDAFFTKEIMTLYSIVDHYHCPYKNKSIILFRFSPKRFDHEVWDKLKRVNIRQNVCEGN